MGKHAIIVIKNKSNEYLQYFDAKWNSYLFMNCKMENKDSTSCVIKKIEEMLNISEENINCYFVGEKTHKKFSESAKIEKEYTHYFYKIELLADIGIFDKKEFILNDIKYKWFSFHELENDERIRQVNSDIVGYIQAFRL